MIYYICNAKNKNMKIYKSSQIKEIENYTLSELDISTYDLMERAATAFSESFIRMYSNKHNVIVVAGPGNNGGDSLAIARLLSSYNYNVCVYVYCFEHNLSKSCGRNLKRLNAIETIKVTLVDDTFVFPVIENNDIIIDGLFGIGLNRQLSGKYIKLVDYLNSKNNTVVAVDVPSGLDSQFGFWKNEKVIINATHTLSFQYPKLPFFFSDCQCFIGDWSVVDIGLITPKDIDYICDYVEIEYLSSLLKSRNKFDHKGCYGHGLLIAGSEGMAGAALLSSRSSLSTGIGKLTILSNSENRIILQLGAPEAIFKSRNGKFVEDINKYDALAIGPGLGVDENASDILDYILKNYSKPLVLDADALNIIALNPQWFDLLPPNTILTPHKGEFCRLFGNSETDWDEMNKAFELSKKQNIIIVLKGAYTRIFTPDGSLFINSNGNPGMATAGSGDVLTGVILSLLAQGYSASDAAVIGVFIHGLAGDMALKQYNKYSLVASDIVNALPTALNICYKFNKND